MINVINELPILIEARIVENLLALENALLERNEKIKTFTPLTPIIGVGGSNRSSLIGQSANGLPTNQMGGAVMRRRIGSDDSDSDDSGTVDAAERV